MNYPQTCTCIPNTAGVVYHNLGCPFASGYSIPYTVPSAPLPIPADLRAAPDWPARVAAVLAAHRTRWHSFQGDHGPAEWCCTCGHKVRCADGEAHVAAVIGRGIAAIRESDHTGSSFEPVRDAAAARAFEETP